MKYFIFFLLISLFSLFLPPRVFAINDPLSVPNNRFGIHLVDPADLWDAASLVNSRGGDWGYVTLVIAQNDRDTLKWQNIFNTLRRLHLIPIIRLATTLEGDHWKIPDENDINSWADFLSNLNWVIRNRYVVIFNEPNQSKEWGGSIDPASYAKILKLFSDKLKLKSPDFFILPAGLDSSAPNSSDTMDEALFLQKMKDASPDVFDGIDGWVSHSYPNPGFSGQPYSFGRGTVRSYIWELNLLSELGIHKNFPIFITETGWPHREGINYNPGFVSEQIVSAYFKTAFTSVWTDNNIVAITPFVLSYQSYPFDNFSWKMPDGLTYYNQYSAVQNLAKTKGSPLQIINISFVGNPIPDTLITDSDYIFKASINNSGQTIFDKNDGFSLQAESDSPITIDNFIPIEPGSTKEISFSFHTPPTKGTYKINLLLKHNNNILASYTNPHLFLIEPPALTFHVQTGFNDKPSAKDFSFIIYDQNETPVQIFKRLSVTQGKGEVVKLKNIVVGKPYRAVILKPYFLPRQEKLIFTQGVNFISFKPMLPLDLDLDGRFTFSDYWIMIFHPLFILKLLF